MIKACRTPARLQVVDQGCLTLSGKTFGIVQRGVDVTFPHLARQLVQHLNAVAIRVVNVDAVRHTVVDAPVEWNPSALQER